MLAFRLSAVYAASFAVTGIQLPFFPVWLAWRGVDAQAIGVLVAIPILVRIVATAPLVNLIDRGVSARALMVGGHLAMAAGHLALLAAPGVWAIAILVALMALAQAPIVPAADIIATEAVRREGRLNYGRLRVWGSVSFLAFSVTGGALFGQTPGDAVLVALSVLCVIAAIAALVTPDVAPPTAAAAESHPARLPAGLVWLIAGAAVIQGSHGAVYAFGSIHWAGLGFSGTAIGVFWAVGVVAEIVLFWVLGRGVGRGASGLGLMAAGAGAVVIRAVGLWAEPGLWAMIAIQALHGLTFGATYLGTMAALTTYAPPGTRGRAQGLYAAAAALTMAGATLASGALYAAAGPAAFLAMAPLGLAGLGLLALAARKLRPAA